MRIKAHNRFGNIGPVQESKLLHITMLVTRSVTLPTSPLLTLHLGKGQDKSGTLCVNIHVANGINNAGRCVGYHSLVVALLMRTCEQGKH
jgi:hypothetical protein